MTDRSDVTVVVFGDVMLDTFVEGDVRGVNPEAPTPLLIVKKQTHYLGGAANVARNVAALGAKCILVGVCSGDAAGRELMKLLQHESRIESHLTVLNESEYMTPHKTRYVTRDRHLLRVDKEDAARPLSNATERNLIRALDACIPRGDVLVVSDYAKGALTYHARQYVFNESPRTYPLPIFVDPRRGVRDWSHYRGAWLVKPNLTELGLGDEPQEAAVIQKVQHDICSHVGYALVTRGQDGMTLYSPGGVEFYCPGEHVRVCDVTGAGDTVMATLATMYPVVKDIRFCTQLANRAGGIVVSKPGTATVSSEELYAAHRGGMIAQQKVGGETVHIASITQPESDEDRRIRWANEMRDGM